MTQHRLFVWSVRARPSLVLLCMLMLTVAFGCTVRGSGPRLQSGTVEELIGSIVTLVTQGSVRDRQAVEQWLGKPLTTTEDKAFQYGAKEILATEEVEIVGKKSIIAWASLHPVNASDSTIIARLDINIPSGLCISAEKMKSAFMNKLKTRAVPFGFASMSPHSVKSTLFVVVETRFSDCVKYIKFSESLAPTNLIGD